MHPSSYDIVRPDLPIELRDLFRLALDLRWSWSHVADELWRRIDARLWHKTQNPWLILQTVSGTRLQELAEDDAFLELLQRLRNEQLQSQQDTGWLRSGKDEEPLPSVAYFSMEFGISEALPIYSGGLGVLAGDYLKTCSQAGLQVTGIGLLYQQGYFRQGLDDDGNQLAFYPYNDPTQLPVVPARDADGEWVHVSVELPGRDLQLRLWRAQIGRLALYLLDSNSPLNRPPDRGITAELYGGGQEMRIQQELVLGIAGVRALHALGITADVFHLNEGHAAFAVLERARQFMQDHRCPYPVALSATRAGNLFTTHTPVDAGFDRFPRELFCRYLKPWAATGGIVCEDLLPLGRNPGTPEDTSFNMAVLATHGSLAVNAVSQLHRRVSQQLFAPLYPRWPLAEIPVGHVTNGVHTPTWDSQQADALWTRACGKERWRRSHEDLEKQMLDIGDDALWRIRSDNRTSLIDWIRHYRFQETSCDCDENRILPDQLLDPNTLTIGFARRFASYKRPNLLLQDPQRLASLLTHREHPVQLLIAGKAHPKDAEGQAMIRQWIHFIRDFGLQRRVLFIIDYDLNVARRLVQGIDLWLNTPRRPWEASGTSGMKVLVNGGINLSTLDGWWAEAWTPETGFRVGDGNIHGPECDAADAGRLYDILENDVIPEFYARNDDGIPTRWVARIRQSMARLTPQFSANRMMAEYYRQYYRPLNQQWRQRIDRNNAIAKDILGWQQRTEKHWDSVHIGPVVTEETEGHQHFSVHIYLGELDENDVRVELYADPLPDEQSPTIVAMQRDETLSGAVHGYRYAVTIEACRAVSDYTPRIVPWHPKARVPLENNLIHWATPT